ncbi:MAG: tetratricopeptide repeat protein, partial [Phycisphaeraceae bacterium]|nr:tetratricopeptide repeat protein [Phycisphaeraceae bacterium]
MLHPLRSVVCILLVFAAASVGCKAGSGSAAKPPGADSPIAPEARARAQALTDKGTELKSEGFSAQALRAFTAAVEENPQLTEAHLGIGTIFRERGIYDKADTAYRKAVVSDPNNFDARYLLGLTNQLKGDLPRAISSYKRALILDKNSYEANRDMGSAILQSGRAREAIQFAKR